MRSVAFLVAPDLRGGGDGGWCAGFSSIEVVVEAVGRGETGTVVALTVSIHRDRALVGDRIELRCTLSSVSENGEVSRYCRGSEHRVAVDDLGNATVYREWPPGIYDLAVSRQFPRPGPPSAGPLARSRSPLPPTQPRCPPNVAVQWRSLLPGTMWFDFLPVPTVADLEAFHVEVEAPEGAAWVEFYKDSKLVAGSAQTAPWSIRVSAKEIIQRARFRAVALDSMGRFLQGGTWSSSTPPPVRGGSGFSFRRANGNRRPSSDHGRPRHRSARDQGGPLTG